jgi:hypothetical protein
MNQPNDNSPARHSEERMLGHGFYNKHSQEERRISESTRVLLFWFLWVRHARTRSVIQRFTMSIVQRIAHFVEPKIKFL